MTVLSVLVRPDWSVAANKRSVLTAAFDLVSVHKSGEALTAVEIGTMRDESVNVDDGSSTLHLADCLKNRHEGRLFSVDIEHTHVESSRALVEKAGLGNIVTVLAEDGARFLRQFSDTIDLLYLDSADEPGHTYDQFYAAEQRLGPRSVVVIDDCMAYNGNPLGKGSRAIPYAIRSGMRALTVPVGKGFAMTLLWRPIVGGV